MSINAEKVLETFSALQNEIGDSNRKKGFREETEKVQEAGDIEAIRRLQGNALMLMVSELAEALEEIRAGRAADESYVSYKPVPPSLAVEFSTGADATAYWESTQVPKPEGVPSELADVVIRALDFSEAWKVDLGQAILDKLAYNGTREYKHGKKF